MSFLYKLSRQKRVCPLLREDNGRYSGVMIVEIYVIDGHFWPNLAALCLRSCY